MTRTEFIDFALINDISFKYKGKEYYILQGNNSCICGEYEKDDSTVVFDKYSDVYQNIENMLNTWNIEGVPLGGLIGKIEFVGN
mgnify:CR=1 FL=1